MLRFDDIKIQKEFIDDWEKLSKDIRSRVDRRLHDWSITGTLPRSAQTHKMVSTDQNMFIIYVTCGKGSFRLWAGVEDSTLVCYRVFSHNQQDKKIGH
jgi:mRNA-degrading endonuclease RelE of RelBE toxin-antitoxin system